VVDVNILQHISQPTDTDPFVPKPTENAVQEQTKDLLCYLWDNYFEINPSSSITLMGVGDAYLGIKQLLTSRGTSLPFLPRQTLKNRKLTHLPNKDAKSKIPCILSFVIGSLRPVRSETDPFLSTWYKQNSLIYVSPDHACWSDEESSRKVKKQRFGRVVCADIKSGGAASGGTNPGDVERMLKRYEEDSETFIAEKVEAWERERGEGDPDETEEEGDGVEGEMGFGMQGVIQSVRVPVL
jgi:histone deacetylase 6